MLIKLLRWFGGDTLNTAIYLKRFGCEEAVDRFTVLGSDAFSLKMKKYIKSEGVGTSKIKHSMERNIGLYSIEVDSNGERAFTYWRENSAARLMFQRRADFSNLFDYDLIYFSGISLAILPSAVRAKLMTCLEGRPSHVKVGFDSNYRPNLWRVPKATRTLNEHLDAVTLRFHLSRIKKNLMQSKREETVANWFGEHWAVQTVLKRGPKGPRLIGGFEEDCKFDNCKDVVDTQSKVIVLMLVSLSLFCFVPDIQHILAKYGHEVANLVIGYMVPSVPELVWRASCIQRSKSKDE